MDKSIESIVKGPRQSNFELLRLIAMLLVVMVHANFFSLASPTPQLFQTSPALAWARVVAQAMSLCCVDVFVLISGWFGIRARAKGFCSLIFQWGYFAAITFTALCVAGYDSLNPGSLCGILMMQGGMWFIAAYIVLYVLSPVLNGFIDSATTKRLAGVTAAFFAVEFYFGWAGALNMFSMGYSPLSFIGLYLLGALLKRLKRPAYRLGWAAYFGSVAVTSVAIWWTRIHEQWYVFDMATSYLSPFIILSAAGLVMWASSWRMGVSKFINWLSASALAVYLLHCSYGVLGGPFKQTVRSICGGTSGMTTIAALGGFVLAVYAAAILLDQPRKWLWKAVSRRR